MAILSEPNHIFLRNLHDNTNRPTNEPASQPARQTTKKNNNNKKNRASKIMTSIQMALSLNPLNQIIKHKHEHLTIH